MTASAVQYSRLLLQSPIIYLFFYDARMRPQADHAFWRAYNAFHVLLSTSMTIMSIILLISVTCPLAIISRPVTPTSETVPRLCTLPLSYPTVQDLLNVSGWRAGCGFACAAPMSFRGRYFDRFWPFSLYRFEPNDLLRLPNLRINFLIPQNLPTIARSCQNSTRCTRETLQLVAPRFQARPPSGTPHYPQLVPELFRGFSTESPVSAAPNDFRMTPLSVLIAEICASMCKNSTFCIFMTKKDTDLSRVSLASSWHDLSCQMQLCPTALAAVTI